MLRRTDLNHIWSAFYFIVILPSILNLGSFLPRVFREPLIDWDSFDLCRCETFFDVGYVELEVHNTVFVNP